MKGRRIIWLAVAGVVLLGMAVWLGRTYGPTVLSRFSHPKAVGPTNRVAAASPTATKGQPPTLPPPAAPRSGPQPAAKAPASKGPPAANMARAPGKTTRTNLVAHAQTAGTNTLARITDTLRRLPSNRAFYPAVGGILVCLAAILLFYVLRSKPAKAPEAAVPGLPLKAAGKPARRKGKSVKIHSCNVLGVRGEARQIWQFDAQNGGFALNREHAVAVGDPFPSRLAAKDWRTLWRHKLNIAWLPPEQAFLRVAQLPQSDFNETVAMVELQLEKLSPLPVAQAVWSILVLPHADGKMQTVIVLIAARSAVEEFLGQLEGQGYLADRLELPLIDQLCTTPITGDGAWIYPEALGGQNTAVVAWWYGGVLENLDLISLPTADRGAALREQLMQSAWAGELDGWVTSPPTWHLVANGPAAAEWEKALQEGLQEPLEMAASLPPPELAALTAKRAAQADPKVNLLPPEFATRYQQQFVDRLWMRGLLAVGGLYLVGLAIYAVALGVMTVRTNGVENQVASLGRDYTNALQIKAQYQVLKERQELKFAALDCWRTIAELLAGDLVLDTMNLSDGKKLVLAGSAPNDKRQEIFDFEAALRKAANTNGPIFVANSGQNSIVRMNPGGATVSWNFSVELKRSEAP